MQPIQDGPSSSLFEPLPLRGGVSLADLAKAGVSESMVRLLAQAPTGACVSWGIPYRIARPVLVKDAPVTVRLRAFRSRWLVFVHTADVRPMERKPDGFFATKTGRSRLNEHAADYVIVYADGGRERISIRRGRQLGAFNRQWGDLPVEAVADGKPLPVPDRPEDVNSNRAWGSIQFRLNVNDQRPWVNWLWAWENPDPRRAIVAVRFEPASDVVLVWALAAGRTDEHPLRWGTRRKAVLRLPRGVAFDPAVDARGRFRQVQLDMGQVISARPRTVYPDRDWSAGYNNRLPELSDRQVLIEYAAHAEAQFHLPGGKTVPAAKVRQAGGAGGIVPIAPAEQRVTLRVVEKATGKCVPVKLHVHGQAGEYLPPMDHHRVINDMWLQDYGGDFAHCGIHFCTYIPGEAQLRLPVGRVFLEVSKGFEIRPVRKVVRVARGTRQITLELENVLPWRRNGWVTADTHVHFLSPQTALLEGAGEGVNVVNLLATQWGELFTNVADFDAQATFGAGQVGSDEHLVRVGTENRQHVLGHISLLGYKGPIILPLTTGGPDESAMGDAVECLLSDWARQCRRQDGLVVMPHFPSPRMENATCIVNDLVDGVEMTSWGDLYGGLDPYSLTDWYRYLNCGYLTAAVGGTDKMSAATAVGTVRTYARLRPGEAFTYQAWKNAVRAARTFVTYGPLMELDVEGKPPGSRIAMSASGGTVDVTWKLASVTVPMSRAELVVNGEIRRSQSIDPHKAAGHWSLRLERSSWLALLVRGHYADKPEIIAAHSSPVAVELKGSSILASADALTILHQVEGALAYLDTIGTRARTDAYQRMRMVLTATARALHNRMHRLGKYHEHDPAQKR